MERLLTIRNRVMYAFVALAILCGDSEPKALLFILLPFAVTAAVCTLIYLYRKGKGGSTEWQ